MSGLDHKTIATVIGARPQFIKASAVSRALSELGLTEAIIHTGQHFDDNMSSVFFEELGVPDPAVNLGIGGGSHGQNTGRMLEGIEKALVDLNPKIVLLYGDTDSTLAGALAAAKLHIPVAHVEAGLRSFNRRMPEEINRIVTDHVSSLLFAPTELAISNLKREGIGNSFLVGDVMFDVALQFGRDASARAAPIPDLDAEFILATVHRAENTNDRERMAAILGALAQSPLQVVFPVHPRTKKVLLSSGLPIADNILAVDPLGYLDMVWLERRARLVLTDSGGVQKEAFFHGVPCVTVREETEWVELVEHGWNTLCPPRSASDVRAAIDKALSSKPQPVDLYGDGTAAKKIARQLASFSSAEGA